MSQEHFDRTEETFVMNSCFCNECKDFEDIVAIRMLDNGGALIAECGHLVSILPWEITARPATGKEQG